MFFLMVMALIQLSPRYMCQGTSADGDYKVSVQVKPHKDSYLFLWDNGTVGIGLREENEISVSFFDPQGVLGVIRYRISKGSLQGKWSAGGQTYTENCEVWYGYGRTLARR